MASFPACRKCGDELVVLPEQRGMCFRCLRYKDVRTRRDVVRRCRELGLSVAATAELVGVSERTVKRDLASSWQKN